MPLTNLHLSPGFDCGSFHIILGSDQPFWGGQWRLQVQVASGSPISSSTPRLAPPQRRRPAAVGADEAPGLRGSATSGAGGFRTGILLEAA